MSDRPNEHMTGDDARGGVDCEYVRDLAEGYVLDAVEPLEHERIAAHLAVCAECRALIAELRGIVAFLPFLGTGDVADESAGSSVAERPSPNAKAAFMARVTGRPTLVTPAVAMPQAAVIDRSDRFRPALAVVPMAAAVVLALVWSFSLQNQLNQTEDDFDDAQRASLAALLTAPAGQAQMYSLTPMCTDCGHGKVKADTDNNVVWLYAGDLDPEMGHEVWLIGGDNQKEKVRDLKVSDSGECLDTFLLDRPLSSYQALVISGVPPDGVNGAATPQLMVEPVAALPPNRYLMRAI